MELKKCTKCETMKPSNSLFFYPAKHHKDGLRSECRLCTNLSNKKWNNNNKAKIAKNCHSWALKNKDKTKIHQTTWKRKNENYFKIYWQQNKDLILKKWAKEHPIENDIKNKRLQRKQWERDNPTQLLQERRLRKKKIAKIWRIKNIIHYREQRRVAMSKKRKTAKGRISSLMSRAIYHSIKKNKAGNHWEYLVGYNVDQLKAHLEEHFLPDMNWDNQGKYGWHIDHKIPIAAFNFETPEDIDFKRCWALKNLQPLWGLDNLKKRDTLEIPFQPSLLLREGNI